MDGLSVKLNKPKRLHRKQPLLYYKVFSRLQPGHIVYVRKKSWNAVCCTSPRAYISMAYKGYYKVIEEDSKGFIVLCIKEKKRFPSQKD